MEHVQNAENIISSKKETVFQQVKTPNVDYGTREKPFVTAVIIKTCSTWITMESAQERTNTARK